MRKSLIGFAAAASIGLASLAAPSTASAGCYGCGVGAGVLGGLVAGAIIGSAIANNPPPPPPGYYPPPPPPGPYAPPPPPGAFAPPPPGAFGPPPPAYAQLAPGCHWARRRVWIEGQGYAVRPVQICH
jgi:hypothetical protein